MIKKIYLFFLLVLIGSGQDINLSGNVTIDGNARLLSSFGITTWEVMSNCGTRPTIATDGLITYFDTQWDASCVLQTKPGLPSVGLWDIASVTGSNNTGWINTTSALRPAQVGANCSMGNPESDGTKLVFLVQNPVLCTDPTFGGFNPGNGFSYNFGGCKTIPCTSGNYALIANNALMQGLGFPGMVGALDPRFFSNNPNKVLLSILESGGTYPQWGIYILDINWTGSTPVLTSAERYQPGDWQTYLGPLYPNCERFYKATSAEVIGGVTWIYTQANQVTVGEKSSCEILGATELDSGIFKFIADGSGGSGWVQVYPNFNQIAPRFINGEYSGYAEFPQKIYGTDWLIFNQNYTAPNMGIGLNTNQHLEWAVMKDNGSGFLPITNLNTIGTMMYKQFAQTHQFASTARISWCPQTNEFVSRVTTGSSIKDKVVKWKLVGIPF